MTQPAPFSTPNPNPARTGSVWIFDLTGAGPAPGLTPIRWSPEPTGRTWADALRISEALGDQTSSRGNNHEASPVHRVVQP